MAMRKQASGDMSIQQMEEAGESTETGMDTKAETETKSD